MSEKFIYSYVAEKQKTIDNDYIEEIIKIKNTYDNTPTENKLTQLKLLDKKAKYEKSYIVFTHGTVGLLLVYVGLMCLFEYNRGISILSLGVLEIILNPFLHRYISKANKEKYRCIILKLAGELLNQNYKL